MSLVQSQLGLEVVLQDTGKRGRISWPKGRHGEEYLNGEHWGGGQRSLSWELTY